MALVGGHLGPRAGPPAHPQMQLLLGVQRSEWVALLSELVMCRADHGKGLSKSCLFFCLLCSNPACEAGLSPCTGSDPWSPFFLLSWSPQALPARGSSLFWWPTDVPGVLVAIPGSGCCSCSSSHPSHRRCTLARGC